LFMFPDSSGAFPATVYRPAPLLGLFRARPVGSWVAIGALLVYLVLCWGAFFAFVQGAPPLHIEADSTTYFVVAGIVPSTDVSDDQLVTFGGNLLGPVLLATILRDPFVVVIFNCFLFAAMINIAGLIPGVQRRFFFLLMALNAQTLVSIATLNKEILASLGLVAFVASRLGDRHRKLLLTVAFVFSLMARWEQVAILLLYLFLESRRSPFRHRHKTSLLFVIGLLSVVYTVAVRLSSADVQSFLVQAEGAGILTRLNSIQSSFGFSIVLLPKALMNLFNRLLTPWYFFTDTYIDPYFDYDFYDLQNQIVIHLQSVAMAVVFIAAAWKRRLSLSQPIPFLVALYIVCTAVSPFIQPRYQYPIYPLLCIQLLCTQQSADKAGERKRRFQLLPIHGQPLSTLSVLGSARLGSARVSRN
jgi:hypothetical protein